MDTNVKLEQISNEFAVIRFGKVNFGNGERLLLEVPGSGKQALLDPVILEAIASLDHDELSRIVEKDRE